MYAVITIKVLVNPAYPTRPQQPPLARALEQLVWDGIRWSDAILGSPEVHVALKKEPGDARPTQQ